MTEPRLKTSLWVQSHLRLFDQACLPMMVVQKGDGDAGAIVLKIVRPGEGAAVLSQVRTLDGEAAWMAVVGKASARDGGIAIAELGPESDADAYIAREMQYDPDIWVLEIEDPAAKFVLPQARLSA